MIKLPYPRPQREAERKFFPSQVLNCTWSYGHKDDERLLLSLMNLEKKNQHNSSLLDKGSSLYRRLAKQRYRLLFGIRQTLNRKMRLEKCSMYVSLRLS